MDGDRSLVMVKGGNCSPTRIQGCSSPRLYTRDMIEFRYLPSPTEEGPGLHGDVKTIRCASPFGERVGNRSMESTET